MRVFICEAVMVLAGTEAADPPRVSRDTDLFRHSWSEDDLPTFLRLNPTLILGKEALANPIDRSAISVPKIFVFLVIMTLKS